MFKTVWHVVSLALHFLSPISLPSIFYCLLFRHFMSPFYFHFSFFAEKEFVALGCFQDNTGDRAMGKLLKNLRQFIDWRDMSKTVKACSEIARSDS